MLYAWIAFAPVQNEPRIRRVAKDTGAKVCNGSGFERYRAPVRSLSDRLSHLSIKPPFPIRGGCLRLTYLRHRYVFGGSQHATQKPRFFAYSRSSQTNRTITYTRLVSGAEGRFPEPVELTDIRARGWLESDVEAWKADAGSNGTRRATPSLSSKSPRMNKRKPGTVIRCGFLNGCPPVNVFAQ